MSAAVTLLPLRPQPEKATRPYTKLERQGWLLQLARLSEARREQKYNDLISQSVEAALNSLLMTHQALEAYQRFAEEVIEAGGDATSVQHLVALLEARQEAHEALAAALGDDVSAEELREVYDRTKQLEREIRRAKKSLPHVASAESWLLEAQRLERAAAHPKWHIDRAFGQIERFAKVGACDEGDGAVAMLNVNCTKCGCTHQKKIGCGAKMYCTSCRGKYQTRLRARAEKAFRRHEAKLAPLMNLALKKDRFGLKYMVLTAPQEGSAQERWDMIDVARRHFVKRRFQPWLAEMTEKANEKAKMLEPYIVWLWTKEWEPAKDGFGHPHFNFMFFGPFLDQNVLREWWQEALREAGFKGWKKAILPWISDARVKRDESGKVVGRRTLREAISECFKYITKDCGSFSSEREDGSTERKMKLADPRVYETICALREGRRSYQPSKGFWDVLSEEKPRCMDCGSMRKREKGAHCPDCFSVKKPRPAPRECKECEEPAYRDVQVEPDKSIVPGHAERVKRMLATTYWKADQRFTLILRKRVLEKPDPVPF